MRAGGPLGVTLDVAIRELLREVVRDEVLPALRDEIRAAMPAQPRSSTSDDDLLSTKQAAQVVGGNAKPATIRAWIKAGKLWGTRSPGGRDWRIKRGDLSRALSSERNARNPSEISTDAAAERLLAKYAAKKVRKG